MNGHPIRFEPIPEQRLLKIGQAATYLGLTAATLRGLTDAGQLPCKMFSGKRMFILEDLNAWIDSRADWIKDGHKYKTIIGPKLRKVRATRSTGTA